MPIKSRKSFRFTTYSHRRNLASNRPRRYVSRPLSAPAPRSPEERSFESTPGWKGAVVRGRIVRPDANGFVLLTDAGETGFYPVKLGANGKIEPDPSLKDDVSNAIGTLARCNQLPIGTYACVALGHDGREAVIPEIPIGAPL